MLNGPNYSLSTWSAELDEAMGSWKMMIPGAKSQPEAEKMQVIRDIMSKMTEAQKLNPQVLLATEGAISDLATKAGTSPMEVKMMLQRFDGLKMYQTWVRARNTTGKRMPKNMEDMTALVRVDMEKDHLKKMRGRARRF